MHVPVLVAEVMATLRPARGETIADCTLGMGGHAREFLRQTAPDGRLIGLDVDRVQLEHARAALAEFGSRVALHRSNFAGLAKALAAEKLDTVDIIFADLGVSSVQIDDPARGVSYKHDGPLDMRLDDRLKHTAADVLGRISRGELAVALRGLADEPDAARIADEVVRHRGREPITTTRQLVDIVLTAKRLTRRSWRRSADSTAVHPAARTFQALRILTNDELNALAQLLRIAPACLRPGGRIGIISFHSGEDRLVKHALREGLRGGVFDEIAPEVIRPGRPEVRGNPRSASAKYRWARRAMV
jgi:16S rRNA (cytosine1402-N4)-methyltransferase